MPAHSPFDVQDLWHEFTAILDASKRESSDEKQDQESPPGPLSSDGIPVSSEEFLHRAAAHELDSHHGTTMLWLLLDDRWTRRVVEHLSLPRLKTIDTTVEFDVDLSVIRRQGARADADGQYWLPLLVSPAQTPSVLQVTDDRGRHVPRLTTAETRWYLSAALADLLVRAGRHMLPPSERRDVELLVSAVLRRWLEDESSVDGAQGVATSDNGVDDDESKPSTEADRRNRIDEVSRKRTRRRIVRAVERFFSMFDAGSLAAEGHMQPEQSHALRLVDALLGLKILFVACAADASRVTYFAELPGRPAEPENPWANQVTSPTLRRLADRFVREGPGPGRARVDLDLVAFSVAPNYHVVVEPPPDVCATNAVLQATWSAEGNPMRDHAERAREAIRKLRLAASVGMGKGHRLVVGRSLANVREDIHDHRALVGTGDGSERSLSVLSPDELARQLEWLLRRPGFDGVRRAGGDDATDPGEEEPVLVAIDKQLQLLQATASKGAGVTGTFTPASGDRRPDRVHISVPASDRGPSGSILASARLSFVLYLADPRPHTSTNLVNRLNLLVLAVLALLTTIAAGWQQADIETSALVAVMLLFTGVLAARIERPGRTSVRGWLARTPYLLGYFSTMPAVTVSVVLVSGIWRLGPNWADALVVGSVFALALVMQLLLLLVGIAADRSARLYEDVEDRHPSDEPVGSVLLPLLRAVVPSAIREALWFEPVIRSESEKDGFTSEHSNGLARLRTDELIAYLSEQLARQASRHPWRVLSFAMPDHRGGLADFMTHRTADERDGPPPLDVAGGLGVSFAGQSLVHLIAAEDHPGALAGRVENRNIWHSERVRDLSSPDHSDLRGAPVRAYSRIYEFMLAVPGRGDGDWSGSAEAVRTFARATARERLPILLLHFPALPPSWSQATPGVTWIRARVGVSHQSEEEFNNLVRGVADRDDIVEMSVASVSEFHRPQPDSGKGAIAFADLLADIPEGEPVMLLVAHAVDRTGLIRQLLRLLHERGHLRGLRALSFNVTSGLALISGVIVVGPASDAGGVGQLRSSLLRRLGRSTPVGLHGIRRDLGVDELESALREGLQDAWVFGRRPSPAESHRLPADPAAWAAIDLATAWPNTRKRQIGEQVPIVQLTWNAPDRRGVFWTLLNELCRADDELSANLLYFLSRVSRVDTSLGRLFLRLEGLPRSSLDGSDAYEAEVNRVLQQIEVRAEQALNDFVHRSKPEPRFDFETMDADRDVFVTVELMRQGAASEAGRHRFRPPDGNR